MQNIYYTRPLHTKILGRVESLYPKTVFQKNRIDNIYIISPIPRLIFKGKIKYLLHNGEVKILCLWWTFCLSVTSATTAISNKWKHHNDLNEIASFLCVCVQTPVKENKSHRRDCLHVSFFPTIFLSHFILAYIPFIHSNLPHAVPCLHCLYFANSLF